MIISYNWLQAYFKEKLPSADKVAELLVFHSFEVESVEKNGEDFIFDIKILPDRAHDCLSHRGLARELSVHLGVKTSEEKKPLHVSEEKPKWELKVNVNEPALCKRYTGLVIEGIKVGSSPDWLKSRMGSIGQKSINNVVDATNFVMFDLGQPLHAFDADKIDGDISVRNANNGEKITTLDGKEVLLDGETLVIADNKGPLAIAGIKGGKKAEVDAGTENIILEAANFSPTNVRKTSKRFGIQTDSSKRFENELSADKTKEAIETAANLILGIAGNNKTKIGNIVDVYSRPPAPYVVGVSTEEINRVLGVSITQAEIEAIFGRLNFEYKIVEPAKGVVFLARKMTGVPYKYGASVVYDAPKAFDCSSFIAYLFAQAGVAVPRMAVDQYAFGEEIKSAELIQAGDVVFSNTGEGKIYYETVEFMKGTKIPEGVDHCGLYLGDGNIIHATRYKGEVVIENLASSEQFKNIVGYRRMANGEKRFAVTVPSERLDIRIKEDLIEEIGKTYGYENIPPLVLSDVDNKPKINKNFYYANIIRNTLLEIGFSEIYTYSLVPDGEIQLENPTSDDKNFLRNSLYPTIIESLELNTQNVPILGISRVKIFEIGKVFKKEKEYTSCAISVSPGDKKNPATNVLKETRLLLEKVLNTKIEGFEKNAVFEFNFDELISKLPEPKNTYKFYKQSTEPTTFKHISSYPFIVRDVALWTPEDVQSETIFEILKEKAGALLAKMWLFDVFKKDGKTSHAFRLVFQSHEKTLTDDEVNEIMNEIYAELGKRGWQVR